ncbi:WxL protein peptidoglycan domain-containing protein, partial [Enterococcus faecalis]
SSGGYTIEGVPNEHQIDLNVGYFYLHEEPGQSDQLKVRLINQANQEKILQVKVTNGNTNSNGLIDYTGKIKAHKSLVTPMT